MAEAQFTPFTPAWPNPAVVGLAWMELFQKGAVAWTEASVKLARTYTEAAAAQAKVFSPMMTAAAAGADEPTPTPAPLVKAAKAVEAVVETPIDARDLAAAE